MSYSGICAPNLQNNSDDVYHVHSLIEGTNYLTADLATPVPRRRPVEILPPLFRWA